MNADGTKTWGDYTTANVGKQIAIVLDGVVKSAPVVNEPITGGQTAISGSFTPDEAKALATVLQTGALPVKLVPQDTRTVGPTLGQESLRQGLMAVLIGLLIVAIYLIAFYRGLGVISVTAMFVFASIFLGILALLSQFGLFALSLPGIAGVVLTIGIAADSSILINERFQEEIRLGKTYRSAAQSGTRHAIGTSVDADLVTFVSALVLFVGRDRPGQGLRADADDRYRVRHPDDDSVQASDDHDPRRRTRFPSRPRSGASRRRRLPPAPRLPRRGVPLVPRFNIDFMGHRRIMFAISTMLLVVSIGALAIRGLTLRHRVHGRYRHHRHRRRQRHRGRDEQGVHRRGRQQPERADQRRQRRERLHRPHRRRSTRSWPTPTRRKVAKATGLQADTFQVTTIGPGWGKNITEQRAARLRALAPRDHALRVAQVRVQDVDHGDSRTRSTTSSITLGIYALAGLEVTPNTVAALLTILGYSLYDTIVVFHRIKENSQGLVKQSFMSMANESINEVLVRSINTTLVSLIPVLDDAVLRRLDAQGLRVRAHHRPDRRRVLVHRRRGSAVRDVERDRTEVQGAGEEVRQRVDAAAVSHVMEVNRGRHACVSAPSVRMGA